jgi:hypothetical protein
MNSERKAFIEAAKKIGINTAMVETPIGLQFKYGSTNDAFKIWQASAQRQGYKLVPVELSDEQLNKIDDSFVDDGDYKLLYKLMIDVD